MRLKTRHFDEIEIDEESIIHFPNGILAFEKIKKYVIINNPKPQVPFQWLQSVDEPALAFVITNPFLFKKDYVFDIPEKVIKDLDIVDSKDVIIYSIAVVPENIRNITINLSGPIIINSKNKKAMQIVLENDDYGVKYRLLDNMKKID